MVRVLRPVILALLAVAPAAAAQGSSFEMEPLPSRPIVPLVDEFVSNWTADLFCPPSVPGQPAHEFHVWASEVPPWAHVLLEPDVVPLDACVDNRLLVRGTMKVRADETAPAYEARQIQITTASPNAIGANATGKHAMSITPGFYSIVGVSLAHSIRVVEPGETAHFDLTVQNHGNARTRLSIELLDQPRGLAFTPISPFLLETPLHGDEGSATDLELAVRTEPGGLYRNEVGVVNLRILSFHALDDEPGDTSQVSLLVTTRGFATPAPPLAPALALALALVTFSHRRTMRP